MIYNFDITTPANTPATAKKETTLKLARGVIHQIDIVFPPGPAALLHVTINDALHQRWPTNSDKDFASDDDAISFREFLELKEEPFLLTAWTWNESTDYAHSVLIRIGLLPRRFVLRRLL